MILNPISVNVENKNSKNSSNSINFGSSNPIIFLMDSIDNGGFAASFIAQDFLGMAAPRTVAGLTRNSNETGEQNTGYARLVAIREVLSGPSTFIIPGLMLWGINHCFGRANNVPINFIKGFSDHLEDIAEKNPKILTNPQHLKETFYKDMVRNLLYASTTDTNNSHYLLGSELNKEVDKFTKILIEMDKAPKKHFWNRKEKSKDCPKYAQDFKKEFTDKFVGLRKQHSNNPSNKIFKAWFELKKDIPNTKDKHLTPKITNFVDNLLNYTNDAVDNISNKFKPGNNIKQFVQDFGQKRIASRFLTNTIMTASVVCFFLFIPKLYNAKDGKNPALAGLGIDENINTAKKAEGKR